MRQNPSKSVEFAVNGVCLCQNRLGYQKRFFRLIRNIPGTDPTNPERYYVPGYLVGHRGEGRRRNGRPQSGERVLPKHKHKFESLFEFDLDVVEDDNQESDGHDSVDAEFPSRVPGLLSLISRECAP